MSKVYLSGPIMGLTYDEARYGWRAYVAERLLPGIEPLSPMRQEGPLSGSPEKQVNHIFSHAHMIVRKDWLDIQACDMMMVNLLGAKAISRGTLVEIGMAYALGKTIITIMEPTGNLHDHPFVRELSIMADNIDDAIVITNAMLSVGV